MRKLAVLAFLSLFCAAGLMAQSVTVTKPGANETWVKGQTYQILWTKSGTMPDLVRISLRNQTGATEVLLIQDNAPNSGSFSWPVPGSVPDGAYRIRVKVKNVAVSDDSEVFTIAAAGGPSITVTKPALNDKWNRSKTYNIIWTKTGTMPNTVKIDLMNQAGTSIVKPIADGVPNTGSYPWPIPADMAFGSYRVRVQVKTTTIRDDSDIFSIAVSAPLSELKADASALLPPFINVVKPDASAVWHNGDHVSIQFKTNTSGTVEILLYNESKTKMIGIIASQLTFGQGQSIPPVGPDAPFQYIHTWELPFGDVFSPAKYTIRIRGYESGIIAWSSPFRITWPLREHEYTFLASDSGGEQSLSSILCVKYTEGLTPAPVRPDCQPGVNMAHVGWDIFDYPGSFEGSGWWRYYISYAKLKFPLEQFMGKNALLVEARLRIKRLCTDNVNTSQASAAERLYRLLSPISPPIDWSQCLAVQKETLYILPKDLTEETYNVESTVNDWIRQWQPNYGFLLSVANPNPTITAASTCTSKYRIELYIKIMEEFKGYTID